MAKRRKPNAKALKHALTRANPHFLVAALMVFQVTAMLLLAFKTDTVDWQAVAFAVAMPLVSQLVLRIFVRLWPVDRTLMVLILFLWFREFGHAQGYRPFSGYSGGTGCLCCWALW